MSCRRRRQLLLSLVLAATEAVGWPVFGRGSIPISEGVERQHQVRYLGIIEVVVESGGVGVQWQRIRSTSLLDGPTDMDIHWMMVIPAIDYEDLRRMVMRAGVINSRILGSVRDAQLPRTVRGWLVSITTKARTLVIVNLYSGCVSCPCGGPILLESVSESDNRAGNP